MSNLNKAIIDEILSHIRSGEIRFCNQLGFSEEELAALEQMTHQEICYIAESTTGFANISINHSSFWGLVENAREKTQQRNLIDRALTLGASSEIIYEVFGLSSAEVSARRKLLGIKEAMGRKPNADESKENMIWELWAKERNLVLSEKESFELANIKVFDALLFIAEELDISFTEVVRLVRYGEHQ